MLNGPMRAAVSFFLAGLIVFGASRFVQAQELVEFPFAANGGGVVAEKAQGILSLPVTPSPSGKLPAVVLLHSAWGWADDHEGYATYAKFLNKAGFVTLELRMFPTFPAAKAGGPAAYLPELFGGLKFLANQPSVDGRRIAVAGYSFGGLLALVAATNWANATYGNGVEKFAAHAPFYPLCWVFKANIKGRRSPVPTEAWMTWTGVPVKIFAGGLDDYDEKDPNACQDAVDALPEDQRKPFSVQVYPGATHGWDQLRSASFYEKFACKGRGCNNENQPNPRVAEQSMQDLTTFLSKSMPE